MKKRRANGIHDGGRLGFEEQLWRASDRLRGHVEPAEYKHIVLGLIFLKYIVDGHWHGAKPRAVPDRNKAREARVDLLGDALSSGAPNEGPWHRIVEQATVDNVHGLLRKAVRKTKQEHSELSDLFDDGFVDIPPKPLVDLLRVIDDIPLESHSTKSSDVLGRVYEYFLAHFASSEGRSGGEYYTPRSVVQLLVDMVRPFRGKVYDPCCGTAGMFVQSERFVVEHGGRAADVRLYGQESSARTLRLARINLALRGLSADLGVVHADTFRNDQHPNLKADYVLANPPFNAKEWGASDLMSNGRWVFGVPPAGNANFAWVQHIYSHLSDDGVAGFVLSNGSLSSNQGGELEIRRKLIEADVIECIVTLPSQLFYGTQIPACLWFISRSKQRGKAKHLKGRTLFIDGRRMGHLVDRVHAELSADERTLISSTYHAWRASADHYVDSPGFAFSATTNDVEQHRFALVPGRYVGFPPSDCAAWEQVLKDIDLGVASRRLQEVQSAADISLSGLRMLRRG